MENGQQKVIIDIYYARTVFILELVNSLLAVVLATVVIVWLEAIFRVQTKLKLADKTERLIILIESKSIEVEITIFISKSNFKQISGTSVILGNRVNYSIIYYR